MDEKTLYWVLFNVFVLLMLALDLGVFNWKAHEVKIKEALIWSGVWIALALSFNLGLYYYYTPPPGIDCGRFCPAVLNRLCDRKIA